MPRVLAVCSSTPDAYMYKCIVTLSLVRHVNPSFDLGIMVSNIETVPQEIKTKMDKLSIQLFIDTKSSFLDDFTMGMDSVSNKPYPKECFGKLWSYLIAPGYDFVLSLDGDICAIQPIPLSLFNSLSKNKNGAFISGTSVLRRSNHYSIQSGVICFHVKKCYQFQLYEKMKQFFKETCKDNIYGGDDSFISEFLFYNRKQLKRLVVFSDQWQIWATKGNQLVESSKWNICFAHLIDKYHPWVDHSFEYANKSPKKQWISICWKKWVQHALDLFQFTEPQILSTLIDPSALHEICV